mgnify:CR=1 FL=1
MVFKIEYGASAVKELEKLDRAAARRIVDYMDKRVAKLEDPRSLGKALTGTLGAFWRYRVGDYRVICDIKDSEVIVLVVRIGHRSDVYE